MRRFKAIKKNSKNTIIKKLIIVFFCIILITILIFNIYAKTILKKTNMLVNDKVDTIIYDLFNYLITDDVFKDNNNELIKIEKNRNDEIVAVNYDIEKTYKLLTYITEILKNGILNLENGKLFIEDKDNYLRSGKNGLVLNVPFFIGNNNLFLVNVGPRIPLLIHFNESILTNLKTKVTNYGFNNALLEIYVTVELQKLIITPVTKDNHKFNYDILIGAIVVNGQVPEFYGKEYVENSAIFDIPMVYRL